MAKNYRETAIAGCCLHLGKSISLNQPEKLIIHATILII